MRYPLHASAILPHGYLLFEFYSFSEVAMTLNFLLLLAVIIFAAKASGWLSSRLGQPAVLGELLIGLVLGPTGLDMLHLPAFNQPAYEEMITVLAELGVIMLMCVAGMEVNLLEMRRAGKVSLLTGTLGVVVPWLLGTLVAFWAGFPFDKALFIGVILTATSVSISAQTLMELKVLRTREGLALLGAAVADDVMVILVLSIFLALTGGGSADLSSLALVIGKIVLFLGLAVAVGALLLPRLTIWVGKLRISEGLLAFAVVATLLFGWSAEIIGGMAAITGAFLAGVFFARTEAKAQIERSLHSLTYGFLVPIFFVHIGLQADGKAIGLAGLPFVILLIIAAIIGKVLGCGLGARLGGYNSREALRVGIGMISRGEVGLIVASVGLANALINDEVFAATVVMVLVTTLVTPPLLRWAFTTGEAGTATIQATSTGGAE